MKSVRGLNIIMADTAKLKLGKHHVRPGDHSRYTQPSLEERRKRNRKANRQARLSRKANR